MIIVAIVGDSLVTLLMYAMRVNTVRAPRHEVVGPCSGGAQPRALMVAIVAVDAAAATAGDRHNRAVNVIHGPVPKTPCSVRDLRRRCDADLGGRWLPVLVGVPP